VALLKYGTREKGNHCNPAKSSFIQHAQCQKQQMKSMRQLQYLYNNTFNSLKLISLKLWTIIFFEQNKNCNFTELPMLNNSVANSM